MKYLNINVTEEDIDRKPDRVRLYDGESSKSIEYEPMRPKGEWIESLDGQGRILVCKHCGYQNRKHYSWYPKFCEDCGADMRGSDKNEIMY